MEKSKYRSAASSSDTNQAMFQTLTRLAGPEKRLLELGAGSGRMARLVRELPCRELVASDISEAGFDVPGVKFVRIDFSERLPFDNQSFDVVYAIEAFEHATNLYHLMEDICRILKPGGVLVFSVPNVSHMKSRLGFLLTGFFDLYLPPSVKPENAGRLCGHINPLTLAYYGYGLRRAGYKSLNYQGIHVKGAAALFSLVFAPILALATILYRRKVLRYGSGVFEENQQELFSINHPRFLSCRTLLISAHK